MSWFGRKKQETETIEDDSQDFSAPTIDDDISAPIIESSVPVVESPKVTPIAIEQKASDNALGKRHDNASPRALYKHLMNGFHDGILVTDNKGHVVDSSIRIPEFFGYTEGELWDMPIEKMVAGLTIQIYDRIRNAIGNARYVLMTTKCIRKDGTTFPAEVGISVFMLMGMEDYVLTIRNIERRMTQIKELRGSKNAYMNSLSGDFVCNSNYVLTSANGSLAAILGKADGKELLGLPIEQIFPGISKSIAKVEAGEVVQCKLASPLARIQKPFLISLAPNTITPTTFDGIVGSVLPEL